MAANPSMYAKACTQTTRSRTNPPSYTVLSSIKRLIHPRRNTKININLSASLSGAKKFFIPKLSFLN